MIVTFLCVKTVYCFCFLLSTYQWKKTLLISIFEWWPVNSRGIFLESFQHRHFPWNLGPETFLDEGHSGLNNLFVKHIATQFISNVAYFGKSLSPPKPGKGRKTRITRKEWGTRKAEILQTQASKMSLIARRYWCQRPTQIIEIGLKDLIQFWYLCSQAIIRYVWQNLTQYRAIAIHYLKQDTAIPRKSSFLP